MGRRMVMAVVILAVLPLVGCGPKIGNVTTNYGQDGRVTSVVEEQAVGDPDTDYYRAVRGVSEQAAGVVVAKADAIKEAVRTEDNDSGEVRAWKSAFAAVAIASIDDTTALNLAAVKKAVTWKDVAKDGVEALKDVAIVGAPVYGAVKAFKYLSRSAGDKTQVQIDGDGNTYKSAKTHINNDVATYATEEGAAPTVNATPAATTASPSTSSTVHEAAELPKVEEPAAPEGEFTPTEPPDFPAGPVEIPGPEPTAQP